ncbi:hypothetical protein G6F57_021209 [Rhizopus arrhizus]|nr:hypothetical protein G6F68_013226 [Rhizopus microsporus]KAG1435247.1 hypothetical protein G6F57_021209 [Rhizopus arrhizus]
MQERYGRDIPWDEPIISPAAIAPEPHGCFPSDWHRHRAGCRLGRTRAVDTRALASRRTRCADDRLAGLGASRYRRAGLAGLAACCLRIRRGGRGVAGVVAHHPAVQ